MTCTCMRDAEVSIGYQVDYIPILTGPDESLAVRRPTMMSLTTNGLSIPNLHIEREVEAQAVAIQSTITIINTFVPTDTLPLFFECFTREVIV